MARLVLPKSADYAIRNLLLYGDKAHPWSRDRVIYSLFRASKIVGKQFTKSKNPFSSGTNNNFLFILRQIVTI